MRKIVTSALVVMATTLGFSQQVKYGVKGGLNFAGLRMSDTESSATLKTDSRTSFYLGGLAEFPLNANSDKLFGQIEVQYAQNGGKEQGAEVRLHQVNVPAFVKYEVVEGLKINGGVYIGVLLGGELKENKKSSWSSDGYEEVYKTFDGGLLLGAEYNFSNGLFIDGRYNLGLANISKLDTEKAFNRTFQLGLGYKF